MAAKRPKIQKIGSITNLHMCIVGPSGSGKTGFMASAGNRCLFLTTDPEGTYTAKALGSDADEIVCKTAQDFDEAYVWLAEEGHKEYEVVCIDNISEAQKLYLYAAKEAALARGAKSDPLVPDPSEYLRAQLAIVRAVKGFHDLPMHVVWTGHQKGFEDEFGEPFYSLVLQGGKGELAQTVLGYMNINVFLEVIEKDNKEVRRFWTSYKGPYRGKDRTQSLGRYKDNLTWDELIRLTEASKKRIDSQFNGNKKTPVSPAGKAATKPAVRRRAVAK